MPRDYDMVIWWSAEDDCYVGSVPDLEGCMAHGESPEEAARELTVAKELWLETRKASGWPIPKPKPIMARRATAS